MTHAAPSSVVSEQSHKHDTHELRQVSLRYSLPHSWSNMISLQIFFCISILARWLTNSFNGRLSLRPRCAQGTLRSSAELTQVDFKRRVQKCKHSYTPAHDACYKTTQSGGTTKARADEFRRSLIHSSVHLFSQPTFTSWGPTRLHIGPYPLRSKSGTALTLT